MFVLVVGIRRSSGLTHWPHQHSAAGAQARNRNSSSSDSLVATRSSGTVLAGFLQPQGSGTTAICRRRSQYPAHRQSWQSTRQRAFANFLDRFFVGSATAQQAFPEGSPNLGAYRLQMNDGIFHYADADAPRPRPNGDPIKTTFSSGHTGKVPESQKTAQRRIRSR